MQEFSGGPERRDDAALVAIVGQIAARAAGNEDLYARLAVLFQKQRAAAEFGQPDCRQQAGRSGTDDDGLIMSAD